MTRKWLAIIWFTVVGNTIGFIGGRWVADSPCRTRAALSLDCMEPCRADQEGAVIVVNGFFRCIDGRRLKDGEGMDMVMYPADADGGRIR